MFPEIPQAAVHLVTPEELYVIASGLNYNMNTGSDGILDEISKHATPFYLEWLDASISSVLTQTHVPCSLTDIII